jgi:hypothetical protein
MRLCTILLILLSMNSCGTLKIWQDVLEGEAEVIEKVEQDMLPTGPQSRLIAPQCDINDKKPQ